MRPIAAALVLACLSLPAAGQVTVTDAWARATVGGQKATGAFMTLTSAADAVLVGAASPVAPVVEIHEMRMDGGVMAMRAVPKLPLPAGKAVKLEPGGYHVMLMALPQPLQEGDAVPLTLTVADSAGRTQKVEVKAVVRAMTAMPRVAK